MAKKLNPMQVTQITPKQIVPKVLNYDKNLNWSSIFPKQKNKCGNLISDNWFYDKNRTSVNRKDEINSTYVNRCALAFDIETYTVPENRHAYMYIWQFLINETVIIGRTWAEFLELLDIIRRELCLGLVVSKDYSRCTAYECYIWIANINYEFNFIKHYLNTESIFAKGPTDLISFVTNHMVFRDALVLSGGGLKDIPATYNTPTLKCVGDLDYTMPRNSLTQLTPQELQYCINDVVILGEFWNYLLLTYVDQHCDIPSTRTGVLRDCVKSLAKQWVADAGKYYDKQWNRVKAIVELIPETYEESLENDKYLFRGGYTHANYKNAGRLLKNCNINGWDFTSSYPAVMLQEQYPMSKFEADPSLDTVAKVIARSDSGYAVKAWYKFRNITAKGSHSLESLSKTKEYIDGCCKSVSAFQEKYNGVIDNGRILYADEITVMLTDVDLRNYLDVYEWDGEPEIWDAAVSLYRPLPSYLLDAVIFFYTQKADLKKRGLDEDPAYKGTYQTAKGTVNAGYGMCSQKVNLEDYYLNDDCIIECDEIKDLPSTVLNDMYLTAVIGSKWEEILSCSGRPRLPKTVLSPYWGTWITAYARRNLIHEVVKLEDDDIYCDTDSVYTEETDKHTDVFMAYNIKARQKNKVWVDRVNQKRGFDRKYYDTLSEADKDRYLNDKNGVLYELFEDLGEFDKINKLGDYSEFKCLGAKRYLKTGPKKNKKTGEIEIKTESTIAGLPKSALLDYCKAKGLDPYEVFTDDMVIPACKNGHVYNEFPHSDVITDDQGHSVLMHEESSVGIFSIDFSMSLTDDYLALMTETVTELRKHDYITGERID